MTILIEGNWHKGLAYDVHTTSSVYIGDDEFGHARYDTERSEMGELVYRLKYRGDQSAVDTIISLLDSIKKIEDFDYLVPIPATKKNRAFQPVELIASRLGDHRGVEVISDLLMNDGDEELKGISDPVERDRRLEEAMTLNPNHQISDTSILLIDDLYRSGATLRLATQLLYEEGNVDKVCVLTMTKTRSSR